jgi:DNA-binding CsgD family transcriptional regulator
MVPTSSANWRASAESSGPPENYSPLPGDAWLPIRKSLRLSDLELRIAQEVFLGQEQDSIDSIASALAISPDLVYRTLQRIYIKLHIGSRRELNARVMSEYRASASAINASRGGITA